MSDNIPDLDAIEARAAAATPGPWTWEWSRGECLVHSGDKLFACVLDASGEDTTADCTADFLAHAREDIPALVAYARRLKGERDVLAACVVAEQAEKRLEKYALEPRAKKTEE